MIVASLIKVCNKVLVTSKRASLSSYSNEKMIKSQKEIIT